MPSAPLPPVPQKLREMLEDYPDCVQRLQESLGRYVGNPSCRDPFRGAILELQGTLEALSAEAGNELAAAEAAGDTGMIGSASKKGHQLFTAGWFVFEMVDMDDLWEYFRANKGAFK
ncbi:hypothetical protein [Pseudoxanthomonas koreensis]|uniref:hypothetical protein n=1 Tax=Pseudoxanthomonas koreensis TaxID=266061 RepID=UPI0035A66F6D